MYPETWFSVPPQGPLAHRNVLYIETQQEEEEEGRNHHKCWLCACEPSSSSSSSEWMSSEALHTHVQDPKHCRAYEKFEKAYWMQQAGVLQQPFLLKREKKLYRCDEYVCTLCQTKAMNLDVLHKHLMSPKHQGNAMAKLQEVLPDLRDKSRFQTLCLPFICMEFRCETNRNEFKCLMCQTRGMPLGVLIAHCKGARHVQKEKYINQYLNKPTKGEAAPTTTPVLEAERSLVSSATALELELVKEPYLARASHHRSGAVVVQEWECLLCGVKGLLPDHVPAHLRTNQHIQRRQLLLANKPSILEPFVLSMDKIEYRCLLCDTKTMMLARLPLHCNGMRHRQEIKNLLDSCFSKSESSIPILEAPEFYHEEQKPEDHDLAIGDEELSKGDSTPNNMVPASDSETSKDTLEASAASASIDMVILEKVAVCRSMQKRVAALAEEQQGHVNHLLMKYLLCQAEDGGGGGDDVNRDRVLLSRAETMLDEYEKGLYREDKLVESLSLETPDSNFGEQQSNAQHTNCYTDNDILLLQREPTGVWAETSTSKPSGSVSGLDNVPPAVPDDNVLSSAVPDCHSQEQEQKDGPSFVGSSDDLADHAAQDQNLGDIIVKAESGYTHSDMIKLDTRRPVGTPLSNQDCNGCSIL